MTPLAQSTADRLSRAIAAAPGAVGELLRRYDCAVPASPETLALMAQLKGDVFTDDLFIVLGQADRATGSRYAGVTGFAEATPATSTPTSQQRTALGRGLKSIVDFLKGTLSVSVTGSAGGIDYDATNDPDQVPEAAPRILGLSQPVFVVGVLVVILAAVLLIVRHQKK